MMRSKPPAKIVERSAQRGLLPVHHRDHAEVVAEHHVAQPGIAPDEAGGGVGGHGFSQPVHAARERVLGLVVAIEQQR